MYKFVIFFALVASGFSLPYPVVEDENGDQYHLVPLIRVRREFVFDGKDNGVATLKYQDTLLDNDKHRLDGQGYITKNLNAPGLSPDAGGGGLNYLNKPSGLNLGASADHTRHGSTRVGLDAGYNFIQTKDAEVGIHGNIGRAFGGPGPSRTDYGGYFGAQYRF